ncbi:hypothetical protein RJ639_038133 [Escallonia herrerae]|uniref:DUF4408 domain-containing protein n=1 Tax=Escallonia herrerae TaxID=1293975 RepID=A0AA88WP57_9ASTE|nr:hypothetical protein RJ639_038133 [Escallonia herrerae]
MSTGPTCFYHNWCYSFLHQPSLALFEAMDKFNKSQILKLSLIVALLALAPLLSASIRPTYLYFVFNLLIISLGAEAGLLSFFSQPAADKKPAAVLAPKAPGPSTETSPNKETPAKTADGKESPQNKAKVVEKCSSEKIVGAAKVHMVKKCPSTPSLFFIGGGDTEAEDLPEGDEEEEVEVPSAQELFTKAEVFIGNFYKQLKMQREDSWKKIHGIYHKAF